MTKARAWVLAARPATLAVGVAPVVVGAAAARGAVRVLPLVAALLGAILIQVGTNFANDVFDAEKGADTSARIGPARAVQSGCLSAGAVRAGMVLAFALAVLVGVYLAMIGGWAIVAIGLASITAGIAYTGGPWPLGYHGLGDVFVFLFFGFAAVCGTALVAVGRVDWLVVAAAVPVGALATAVLVVNNVRDATTDVVAGKRTLVVRLGRAFGVAEYAALIGIAYSVPVLLAALHVCEPWVLLPLATIPLAARLIALVAHRTDGPALNEALATTARLLLMFAVSFALGLRAG